MNRNQLRKVHRTVFIFAGIFIVAWVLSGLLMIMPPEWFGPVGRYQNPPADWSRVTLSPAEAIARATGPQAAAVAVREFSLRQIDDQLLYGITLADGKQLLVDAGNGSRFEFTPALAESILRKAYHIDAPLQEISVIEKHNRDYAWGSLPAWHVTFRNAPSTDYYLSEQDLRVFNRSPVTRVRAAIMGLHEFKPLTLLTDNQRIRKGLMMGIAALALVGSVIGVLLTLPGNRK